MDRNRGPTQPDFTAPWRDGATEWKHDTLKRKIVKQRSGAAAAAQV